MTRQVHSVRGYLVTWITLLVLTGATIGVAYLDLGRWNTAAAVLIAAMKGSLVMIVFMHLREADRGTGLNLLLGFLVLASLLILSIGDVVTRGMQ